MSRIAVWNTAFLGDAVLTLPLIAALKAALPDAEVDFFVRPGLGSLFSAQPELAAVYEQRKAGGLAGLADLFRLGRKTAGRYDLWVGCHQSPRSSLAALLSRATVRVGYSGSLLRRLCYTRLIDRRFGELHEIDRLLRLASAALGEAAEQASASASIRPGLALVPAARDAAERFWNAHVRGPCLGVHPGSVWPTKCWPAEGFAHVVRAALDAGADVIVFGGPGEETSAGYVCECALRNAPPSLSRGTLHDLSGRLTLPELAAFIDRLNAYLGNDSGPLHLAWSRGVPVTALFGPTTENLGFFPRGEQATVLETPLPCRPCGLHGPRRCPLGHHRCMTDIMPETVWEDVRCKLFGF